MQMTPNSYMIYKKMLNAIVDNDWDIPGYGWKPSIVENTYTSDPRGIVPMFPYIIITADSLEDAFNPLIQWLSKKGIEAHTISVSDIVSEYPGGDTISRIDDDAGSIRAFLMEGYERGLLQWVLLGGDEDIVPCRYGTREDDHAPNLWYRIPADLYYAEFDGNWNKDWDILYGEPNDDDVEYASEIYVGRLLCHKRDEIANWIEKLFVYEKSPGLGEYNYLTKVFWSAQYHHREHVKNLIDSFPEVFSHDTALLEKEEHGHFPQGSMVIDTMSLGYGNFNFYGHGATDRVSVCEAHHVVALDSCDGSREIGNGLDSLTNKGYYGWLYSVACYIGAYDHDDLPPIQLWACNCDFCVARAFTILEKRGGPVFLGNTRKGWIYYSPILHAGFLSALFSDSLFWVGVTEAKSKEKYENSYKHRLCLTHNLFGCPEMPIWTKIPQHFVVSFPPFIHLPDSEVIDYTVEVNDILNNTVDSAYVCLWKGEDIYKTKFTSGGIATFYISPESVGWMYVTVTKPNYIPFEDSSYVLEELISCVNTCMATYPNAQKKIRYLEQSNNDIGLIYSSYEDSISVIGSPNNGSSWEEPSLIGEGRSPSLTIRLLNEYDLYHWNGVYLNSNGLVAAIGTTSVDSEFVVPKEWEYQNLWKNPIYLTSSASDRGNNLHTCILYNEFTKSCIDKIRYREYEWEEFPDNSWRLVNNQIVATSSDVTHRSPPAIAVDLTGTPHLVWEWNGKVYYSTKDSTGQWCNKVKLSSSRFSKEPFIEYRGDYVRAVWVQEKRTDGKGDIVMRKRRIDDPPDFWSWITYIRKTIYDSRYPQVAGGEYYSWCENDGNEWDVFVCSEFGNVENISNSLFNDQYPQTDYNPSGHLYCGWTKNGPQGSGVVEKTLSLGKTRYYTVEGGDSVLSKRLVHRDGFTTVSGYPFDYAEDSLVYNLPFIDSTRLFTLKLKGYSGELSSWDDSLSGLNVLIDGNEIGVISQISSIPTVECEIPLEMYRKDEEVILTLKPEIDEYAIVSGIELFDSEIPYLHKKEFKIEPVNVGVPYYLTVHPNPALNNRINIKFGLPKTEKVNLSIYDCTGRCVVKLLSESMKPGIHSIPWNGINENEKELPSGIYFCELKTEDIRIVKKIILLR